MPGITDVHVHLEPYKNLKPAVFETMRRTMPDFDATARKMEDPRNLLAHLDAVGVERACLINYAAPEVMGLGLDVNGFVSKYASEDPKRLLAFGGIHPWLTKDPEGDVERLASQHELRGIKIHPPHQLFAPNAYVDGKMPNLWRIYRAAERVHLPIMFHTGTSVFPGARSKFGDPMALDDVATDFPDLTILMAHGGRPLWCDTAFYLLRAHENVYLDISSIPPARLRLARPRDPGDQGGDRRGEGPSAARLAPGENPHHEREEDLPLETKGPALSRHPKPLEPAPYRQR